MCAWCNEVDGATAASCMPALSLWVLRRHQPPNLTLESNRRYSLVLEESGAALDHRWTCSLSNITVSTRVHTAGCGVSEDLLSGYVSMESTGTRRAQGHVTGGSLNQNLP